MYAPCSPRASVEASPPCSPHRHCAKQAAFTLVYALARDSPPPPPPAIIRGDDCTMCNSYGVLTGAGHLGLQPSRVRHTDTPLAPHRCRLRSQSTTHQTQESQADDLPGRASFHRTFMRVAARAHMRAHVRGCSHRSGHRCMRSDIYLLRHAASIGLWGAARPAAGTRRPGSDPHPGGARGTYSHM